MGAFDVPFHVFAFDDAWVGTATTSRIESPGQAAQAGLPASVADLRVVRGESRPGGRLIVG